MWENKKLAVYTGTRNLYPMMVPAVKSLLTNSDVDEVWIFAEDDELPEDCTMPEDLVKVRNVSDQKYFKKDGPNMKSRFTYMAMMRAALAKEFPEHDRILSLDVDTIITDDCSYLWNLPLRDKYYFAASKEPAATRIHGYFYTNIGVCLYNLEKLRDGKCDEVIEALNTNKYNYLEQDAFNELCRGAIYDMPSAYNSNPFTKVCDKPVIVHYAGEKYWDEKSLVMQYQKTPWEQIRAYRKRKYGK